MSQTSLNKQRNRSARSSIIEPLEDRRLMAATQPVAAALSSAGTSSLLAASLQQPTITGTTPSNGATGVQRDAFLAADVFIPNGGIDSSTITSATVKLIKTSDGSVVSTVINTSAAGDLLIVRPAALLAANTNYTFQVTGGLKDVTGTPFVAFSSAFTTGTGTSVQDTTLKFQQVNLTAAPSKGYTSVLKGPDGKLYATTDTGEIMRFVINTDGTLGAAETLNSIVTAGGPRFLTSLVFDPASTAGNLIAWVSNNAPGTTNTADWTGKITKLSGPNLENVQDMVVGLPRSTGDHMTNQLSFGPDGAIYFDQAANTAMGGPDNAWGNRNEHLLTAAILRLDPAKLTGTLPVNVQTDEGGTYDPFAANAPLTIYASGVRNAYDLIWHSNGKLYAPTNGSQSGGSTPGTPIILQGGPRIDSAANGAYVGPTVPGIPTVTQVENDYLFNVQQGGYYGHPNPSRTEYVQDGGNPTAGVDAGEFTQYPVGTLPDRNYRGFAYDFGQHFSPDGAIEYKGNAFGGALNNKILVTRYSGGDDIMVLTVGPSGEITDARANIQGLTGFVDPLDVTEDPTTGYLYVIQYGGKALTLVKPVDPNLSVPQTRMLFNDPAGGLASPVNKLSLKNTGTSPVTITSIVLSGSNADQFQMIPAPNLPYVIQPGTSLDVPVIYNPGAGVSPGIKTASLTVLSDDPNHATTVVSLRALATTGTGGTNEPSLQRVLDLYDIPVNVGDANPNNTQLYSASEPLLASDEVAMPRLVKAGSGAVTIEVLDTFGVSSNPALKFGTYTPGSASTKSQLFTISTADAQSVNAKAIGSTSFDPGAGVAFGLYTTWPGFTNPDGTLRDTYSEDALNAFESTAADQHKVRFYPLKDKTGALVPNAYIVAFEEYVNDPNRSYDNQDIVAIVRNVAPASGGPEIGLENLDGTSSTVLTMNRIQTPNTVSPNTVHDTATLRLRNTGDQPLVINALSISTANFSIPTPPTLPLTIQPGGFYDLAVKFVSTTGDLKSATLTIASNDADEPAAVVTLKGFWQVESENKQEPTLTEIRDAFGMTTTFVGSGQDLNGGGLATAVGEEVLSPYWKAAEPGMPVTVRQIAAEHTQGNTASLSYFSKDAFNFTGLLVQLGPDSQSFYPHMRDGVNVASFNPGTTAFGFQVDGESSVDARNVQEQVGGNYGHHMRFWPMRDAAGNYVPNTFIMSMDYSGINYDYQDNVYIVTNVRPELSPSAPAGLTAISTTNVGVALQWADSPEAFVTGYNVYRSTSPTSGFAKLTLTPQAVSEYTDATTTAGTKYYYRVTAVTGTGIEGQPSSTSAFGPTSSANPPAIPGSLIANAVSASQIDLAWTDVVGESGYKIERSPDGSNNWQQIANVNANTTTFSNTALDTGVAYFYRIRSFNTAGNSGYTSIASGTTVNVALPAGWASSDIGGASSNPGSAAYSGGTFTIGGSGADVYGNADGFYYTYRQITGDVEIVAKVSSITNTNINAKGGVMIRESLAAGAKNVMMEETAARGPQFQWRNATDGATNFVVQAGNAPAPYWVKLVRSANVFNGYTSADGVTWTLVSSTTLSMSATLYVGLAVTSHDVNFINTSTFENVTVNVPSPLPAAPDTLSGTAVSSTKITLNWIDRSGNETGFKIERSTDNGATWTPIGAVGANVTSYPDSTVTASTAYQYRVRATNVAGNSAYSNVLSITTPSGSSQAPFSGSPITMPGLIEAENFDTGGDGIAWHDLTAGNSGGAYRTGVDIDLETTTDTGGGYNIGSGKAGEWTEYTVNVPVAGTYTLDVRVAADFGYGGTFHVEFDGANKTGAMNFPATGGWQTWQTVSKTVTLDAGVQVMRLSLDGATNPGGDVGNINWMRISAPAAAPADPTDLAPTASGQNQVNLTWTDNATNESGYRIERSIDGLAFTEIDTTGPDTTTYQDGGRSASTTYYYRVRAYNPSGNSGYSDVASATTDAPPNTPPTVANVALVNPSPVVGTTAALTVLGTDDAGESHLTYAWTTVGAAPAPVSFSANGNNAAKNVVATFTKAGTYTLRATITDTSGGNVTSDVTVVVNQTVTTVTMTPPGAAITIGATQQFSAAASDQFGAPMAVAPAFTWSIDAGGVGTVDSTTGLYTSPVSGGGAATVRVSVGSVSTTGNITVSAFLDVTNGLADRWQMDEGSGAATTDNGGTNPGTLTNGPTWVAGKVGPFALNFDGVNDFVNVPNGMGTLLGGTATLTTWIKTTQVGKSTAYTAPGITGIENASGSNDTFWGWIDNTGRIGLQVGDNTAAKSANPINDGQWHHVAFTRDSVSGQIKVYVDGVLNSTVNTAKGTFTKSFKGFGRIDDTAGTPGYLKGALDELRIYNRVLTADEITTVMNVGNGVITPPPVNQAPTIITAASANPQAVIENTSVLSVLGADDTGGAQLNYVWSIVSKPAGAADPTFSLNNSNSAKNSTATFTRAGGYTLRATIRDPQGVTVTSDVVINVMQTFTSVAVAPPTAVMINGQVQTFSATAKDQFGDAMAVQPAFTWSIDAVGVGGTVDSTTGAYTAPALGTGTATIRATAGTLSGTAAVNVQSAATAPIKINFQPAGTPTVNGYLVDDGSIFGSRSGQSYGWNVDHTTVARDRNKNTDQLLDTVVQFHASGKWEIALPNGNYSVKVGIGDSQYASTYTLNVEGTNYWNATALAINKFQSKTVLINVTDGKLTLDQGAAAELATRLNYIEITPAATVTPPTVLTAASANPQAINGNTSALSVLGADDAGEAALTYAWSAIGTVPAPVTFSANGTNAAKNANATFTRSGSYTLRATITDGQGASVTSDVTVVVNQTLNSIVVTPVGATVVTGGTQQFAAVAKDQFGDALLAQPQLTWSIDAGGVGTVTAGGLYAAPTTGTGIATIRATSGVISGTSGITVQSTAAAPIKINFQLATALTVAGYLVDGGSVFADRGNGQTYGWNIDHTTVSRDRDKISDQLLDTVLQFHAGGKWEIALANGSYSVKVGIGDSGYASTYTLNVEGTSFWNATALGVNKFQTKTLIVNVTDGRLTLDQGTAAELATRINFIEITPV